jgi:glucosamine kinase
MPKISRNMFMNNDWPVVTGRISGRVLGIDAGGSATRTVLVADGQVLARETAPPMNALLTGNMEDQLAGLISAAAPDAAGVGMPGLRSPQGQARLGESLTKRTGCPVTVTWDGAAAWMGAFGGEPGIVLLAGTGSAAVGYDGIRWARAGGHGFLLGDEGGAYWIGRTAVSAALRFTDGMGGSEAIARAVTEASGCDLETLVRKVHEHPAARDLLARFAPVITSLAESDDVAAGIVRQAAGHLAELAEAVRRRFGPLPVSGIGGVLRAPAIWDRFAGLVGAVPPVAPPEFGAAMLAAADPARRRWPIGTTLDVAGDPPAPSSVTSGSSATPLGTGGPPPATTRDGAIGSSAPVRGSDG